jgi:hypothetical protein
MSIKHLEHLCGRGCFTKIIQTKVLRFYNKKRGYKEGINYWLSPHAGQIFCDFGIFAPHSTQYLIEPLSSPRMMPTDLFCIEDMHKK